MADLAQHAGEHGTFLMLDRAADLAEAKRPQRAAVTLALPDLALHLGDPDLRHLLVVLLLAEPAAFCLFLLLRDGFGGRSRSFRDDRCSLFNDGYLFGLRLRLGLRLRRRPPLPAAGPPPRPRPRQPLPSPRP